MRPGDQRRSQDSAMTGTKEWSGGRKSPNAVQGQTSREGLGQNPPKQEITVEN